MKSKDQLENHWTRLSY